MVVVAKEPTAAQLSEAVVETGPLLRDVGTEVVGVYIKTYGCQMNIYDSQKMEELLLAAGYQAVSDPGLAKIIIVNTCNIREKAAEKLYSELGRLRSFKYINNAILVVAGCVGQAEGEEVFVRAPYVDIVLGPQTVHTLLSLIRNIESNNMRRQINIDFPVRTKFDFLPEENTHLKSVVSAFLTIQEGCDKFCAFCCVPYTRGAEYSRPEADIFNEAKALVAAGAREIVLLGQNVNAYRGLNKNGQVSNLGLLLQSLSTIDDLIRLRYVSSHPIDMHEDLYIAHATNPKVVSFLHLPVQSGSNKVLRAMNRKHDVDFYLDIISKARRHKPDIQFSSDFIVGYPGEEDEDFEATLNLVRTVGFAQAFSFMYSARPGTPAATRETQSLGVPESIKKLRLAALQHVLDEQQLMFNQSMQGALVPVLFEKRVIKGGRAQVVGRTPYMQLTYVDSDTVDDIGKERIVRIEECFARSLRGCFV